jgi:hypothetical protein
MAAMWSGRYAALVGRHIGLARGAACKNLGHHAKSIKICVAPANAATKRFMSARVPLPEPAWKQQENIEDTIATNMDSATGLERAEILANLDGQDLFDVHPIGPFGTKEKPFIIESIYDERIGRLLS